MKFSLSTMMLGMGWLCIVLAWVYWHFGGDWLSADFFSGMWTRFWDGFTWTMKEQPSLAGALGWLLRLAIEGAIVVVILIAGCVVIGNEIENRKKPATPQPESEASDDE